MPATTIELTKEEIVQRGKEIYYRDILPCIASGNDGRIVAIDVVTGEYEIGDDAVSSSNQLRRRLAEPVIFSCASAIQQWRGFYRVDDPS